MRNGSTFSYSTAKNTTCPRPPPHSQGRKKRMRTTALVAPPMTATPRPITIRTWKIAQIPSPDSTPHWPPSPCCRKATAGSLSTEIGKCRPRSGGKSLSNSATSPLRPPESLAGNWSPEPRRTLKSPPASQRHRRQTACLPFARAVPGSRRWPRRNPLTDGPDRAHLVENVAMLPPATTPFRGSSRDGTVA